MNRILQRTIRGNGRRLTGPALGTAIVTACALAQLGCTGTKPTEIVAGVSTQIRVPDDLRAVGMSVQVGGSVVFCQHYRVTDGLATLPGSLGVLGESGLASRGTVTVQVVGFRADDSEFSKDCINSAAEKQGLDTMVIRRRRLTFVDDQIKFLPLPLKESCADNLTCDDDETCIGGKCVSADVDSTTLPTYDDSLLFGTGNTCFDAKRCMPEGATVPVELVDKKTCTFRAIWPDDLPKPTEGGLNVRLYYKSFGSEVLDLDFASTTADQREGFTFAGDSKDPLSFQLAPNLCESNYNLEQPNVLSIDASAFCTAKRALQPICADYVPPDLHAALRGPVDPGDPPGPGICTLGGLEPVESVVYVLMDHSQSMDKFFGEGGLQFAIGLPLSNPVAKRTKIGFEFLPPEAEQCGTGDYANPAVPFGGVEQSRDPIGLILAGENSVLAQDPPQFFLEAALQGAYQGVAAVQANNLTQGFNRRAVVVISNRDISQGSCPGPTAIELAQGAHDAENRIFTYAVALDSGEPQALESAQALANAGGTTVFNGVTDETKGARAVNDILTELGTCLYKVNRSDAAKDETLPQTAHISYIHPTEAGKGVDIPFNGLCSENAGSDVSGWKQESGGLVRLCGQACEELRQAIGDVGVLHAVQLRPAPAVPLVVTAPCEEFQRH